MKPAAMAKSGPTASSLSARQPATAGWLMRHHRWQLVTPSDEPCDRKAGPPRRRSRDGSRSSAQRTGHALHKEMPPWRWMHVPPRRWLGHGPARGGRRAASAGFRTGALQHRRAATAAPGRRAADGGVETRVEVGEAPRHPVRRAPGRQVRRGRGRLPESQTRVAPSAVASRNQCHVLWNDRTRSRAPHGLDGNARRVRRNTRGSALRCRAPRRASSRGSLACCLSTRCGGSALARRRSAGYRHAWAAR